MCRGIEQHYTLREASELLSVSTRTLRRWIQADTLRATKWPSRRGQEYRISISALVERGFEQVAEIEPEGLD